LLRYGPVKVWVRRRRRYVGSILRRHDGAFKVGMGPCIGYIMTDQASGIHISHFQECRWDAGREEEGLDNSHSKQTSWGF
jgi:hypothetical protein